METGKTFSLDGAGDIGIDGGSFLLVHSLHFYSKAVNLCPGVEVKWENGGVSPAALVKQQTFARQDGAAEQPEVTHGRRLQDMRL